MIRQTALFSLSIPNSVRSYCGGNERHRNKTDLLVALLEYSSQESHSASTLNRPRRNLAGEDFLENIQLTHRGIGDGVTDDWRDMSLSHRCCCRFSSTGILRRVTWCIFIGV
jgi:hypothetical protein